MLSVCSVVNPPCNLFSSSMWRPALSPILLAVCMVAVRKDPRVPRSSWFCAAGPVYVRGFNLANSHAGCEEEIFGVGPGHRAMLAGRRVAPPVYRASRTFRRKPVFQSSAFLPKHVPPKKWGEYPKNSWCERTGMRYKAVCRCKSSF
ncbi:MAG: hypothetical protein JWR26_1094 [Pedosphaera sp.]|nr:hypothetical protein [Pedosphaera sp.]